MTDGEVRSVPTADNAATIAPIPAEPAPGQLVTVRHRQWVTADVVRGSVVSDDPFGAASTRPQHLATLVSVEDDAREEELRVIWELECGASVYDQRSLPAPTAGFDEPRRLDAFLDAVRWGAIASADRTALQAPFRSGIQIEDYQLDPVVRALSMPRTNLLIADDVGLGKTIEAGLVAQELMLRHRARTMLIVCPASLTVQWRDEMRDKFGLDFRVLDTALLRQLRRSRGLYANPWTHYPRLIVSVDWLKRDRPMRMLREILPPVPEFPRAFDLLIVDEVHTCAPSGSGKYAVDSRRTRAIRELAPHCEHRLFLSATPHNGYLESFTALLELLDDRRFARGVRPAPEQLAQVMTRRLKRDLPPRWDGSPRFPRRELRLVEVDHNADTRAAYALLTEYAESRRSHPGGAGGRVAADFVVMLLKKRFLSSPKAFAETVDTHLATMNARETDEFDGLSGLASPGPALLRPLADRLEETAEDDEAFGQAATEALHAARRLSPPLSPHERELLERLRDWARAAQDRADEKFAAFLGWLNPIVRDGDAWGDQRAIVFTEYRDTQRWLHERLLAHGVPASRIALLYGGQDGDERERVKAVFQEAPELDEMRVLLATDAASEGINLQRHCHHLLHWEIPWNPNRLEQRNGRVDRHGQRAEAVQIAHFAPAGWQHATTGGAGATPGDTAGLFEPDVSPDGALDDEMRFLAVAVHKVEQIREDLGSAGEVIAAQVERKMLGRQADWRTADAEIERRSGRARLKVERDLSRELDRLVGELTGSRTRLRLTPAAVERVVRTALELAHRQQLIPVDAPEGVNAPCFRLPSLPGAWAEARNAGLSHPVSGEERPVCFDQDAVADRTDVVLLHLGNRLVQMCLRLLRAELWSGGASAKLRRVTARVVQGDLLSAPVAVAHGRVVITGGGARLHEEVLVAGGMLVGGVLEPARQDELDAWLSAAGDDEPGPDLTARLAQLWPTIEPRLVRALEVRADQRSRSLNTLLARRCAEEESAIRSVLGELARSIQQALGDEEHWRQASLFEVESERDQLRRDHQALTERLAAIPDMVQRETAAIRARYADPTPRWFPVAVTFLVPASMGAR